MYMYRDMPKYISSLRQIYAYITHTHSYIFTYTFAQPYIRTCENVQQTLGVFSSFLLLPPMQSANANAIAGVLSALKLFMLHNHHAPKVVCSTVYCKFSKQLCSTLNATHTHRPIHIHIRKCATNTCTHGTFGVVKTESVVIVIQQKCNSYLFTQIQMRTHLYKMLYVCYVASVC
ncbi:unnamed protein product [Ceratitis capitata]|uniref:(Mediterranean fruit fly) hypothetical protein n=1 Tax=Ceratitis capitata TaxID=7213 RepID=A0A811UXZ7_CERCA|nr:unnamed protein product [Ceratitis capitata]